MKDKDGHIGCNLKNLAMCFLQESNLNENDTAGVNKPKDQAKPT